MRVRFQADADLNLAILLAVARRDPTVDFQAGQVAGLARARGVDQPHLLLAALSIVYLVGWPRPKAQENIDSVDN